MNGKSKLKLKMISSLLTCALSLFSLVTLTFSWFALNKTTGGGGMGALIKDSYIVSECEYYVIPADDNGSGEYTFVPPANASDCDLGPYDILKDRYQLLVKVKLKSAMQISVTAKTETTYFLGKSTAQEDGHWLTASGEGNYLSSVASFTLLNLGENGFSKTADGYKLTSLPEETVCFFDRNTLNDGSLPQDAIIATGHNAIENADGEICFFMLLSYDPLLMSTVFSVNIGNPVIENDENSVIPFTRDFEIQITAA